MLGQSDLHGYTQLQTGGFVGGAKTVLEPARSKSVPLYHQRVDVIAVNRLRHIFSDSGPGIFNSAGQGIDEGETALKITGNGISNPTFNPSDLRFVYAGAGDIDLAGGAQTSALVYAPNATGKFTGGSDFYGAVVLAKLTAGGGATIHYDRNLGKSKDIPGNFTMNQFFA